MSSEGRLRIDVPVIKRSGVNAATVKGALEQLCGIRYVMACPSTGRLLVFFDSRMLTDREIIDRLNELNAFEPAIRWHFAGPRDVCRDIRDIAEILVRWIDERFEDWLDAERDLVIQVTPEITLNDEDITIEVLLPTLDMPNVAVHIAPRQFLLSSDIDEEGFQICQVIDLPCDISMDGVDAEQNRRMIRITAILA
jgi:hypothetical protein